MRALIVRFLDCEGPGILEPILREKGYRISYHNAYDKRLTLMPEAHLNFSLIVLMGGPMSVADESVDPMLSPYIELVQNVLNTNGRKLIGICLGGQIIAKALGARVNKGDKGPEVGFSQAKIVDKNDPIFSGIHEEEIQAFHLHEDLFSLPEGAKLLLAGDFYQNQMFSYKYKAFAFQTHIEPTLNMLNVWFEFHKDFISKGKGDFSNVSEKQQNMESSAKIIFRNILNI